MCETLREPVKVLKSLSEQAINKQYKFKRLYRNLYNPEFYFLAYKNISQSQGSMTSGVDGKSLDGMSEKRISALIESIRSFSYQPNPARRVYIEKKNSTKKRPLGIPSTEDKLVQEVVKMILESIYEPNFSDCSHGFRPKRSCHSALQQIQNQFTGITWFVEGDIHACFDSFDHHVLVNILRERIEDENFLALIWKMLKAGYMEQWAYNCTFSGTPQGSGVSPILANIYLSKLDDFAENLKKSFNKGKSKENLEYQRAASKLYYIRRKNRANWENWNEQQRKEALRLQKDAINYMHSLPSKRANNKEWENQLLMMEKGQITDTQFMGEITSLVGKILSVCREIPETERRRFQKAREVIGKCPVCGSDVYEGKQNFYCSNRQCDFALWKENRFLGSMEKTLDKKMAVELLDKACTHVKGLYSRKKDIKFDADLLLTLEDGKPRFHLEFPKKK